MNVHEYQAKEIFRAHGIPVPPGEVARTPGEARALAERFGGRVVVKAQVHSGGRGKAGGVKLAENSAEAEARASAILGMQIQGLTVRQVLVAPTAEIAHEYYVGIVLDRAEQKPLIMLSREGGIDIEEVARTKPEALVRHHFDPVKGLRPFEARSLALAIEPEAAVALQISEILRKLARVFVAVDATLAEINPLIQSSDGKVSALDAKLNLDDNALYRHPEIEAMRDLTAELPEDAMARAAGLSFIKLDGEIGCVVNGAGLAMATMDLVNHFGGTPANFLDIGGSSDPQKVVTAIRIITGDPKVRVILFNIFGGITRCDDVARGLIQAVAETGVKLPIVIRLTGTNEAEARSLLQSQPGLVPAETMDDAVRRAVELARQAEGGRG